VLHIYIYIYDISRLRVKVKHTRGVDNAVADALSRMFEGDCGNTPEVNHAALL